MSETFGLRSVAFSGRGGQGVRTAGRILGRAAFVSGFWVQDFPVYGTERRGAPVTSYVRFSSEPIQERGTPAWVNLLVKLDATVPYGGRAGLVVVNSSSYISGSRTCDMRSLGSGLGGQYLSAAGAAVAASALGLELAPLLMALDVELDRLQVQTKAEEKKVATEAYECSRSVVSSDAIAKPESLEPAGAVEPIHVDGVRGIPIMYPTGSSRFRMTGSWRTLRPVVDKSRCKSCFLCYVACPEAVISLDGEERPIIDYDNCKGCLICKQVCPFSAIGVEVESS
ncbi:MAG: 2-oxoacid:acceptor oxidoreductase family protein [Thermoprotei archaeon]|nr:2-oxoacid:acceptor oxidoreductase family protein [TACK group archaeon]